ncbi:MAG: diacylglycerol kinase, partial [Solobacterium sp.]|nr:diacylglycerol kinase [Solobacterium sp.]
MKRKFGPAFHGLGLALRDPSFRTQCFLALLAAAAGIVLRLESAEWLAVVICIGMVLT